jgi:hypothetical protein
MAANFELFGVGVRVWVGGRLDGRKIKGTIISPLPTNKKLLRWVQYDSDLRFCPVDLEDLEVMTALDLLSELD